MHLILDPRSHLSDKRSKNRFPSKWVIIGTVSSIIVIVAIIIIIFIVNRSRVTLNQNHENPPNLGPASPSERNNLIQQPTVNAQKPLRDEERQENK
ncbi:unnamed protein product [Rotaria sp. Silwood1]|nr:unnamed protein product [Rotaria sp. Silwood1]